MVIVVATERDSAVLPQRRQRMKLLRSVVVTVAFAVIGLVARAQTDYSINYSFNTSAAYTFDINYLTASGGKGVNSGLDVYAAPFSAQFNGAAPVGYSKNPFSVFCVDLDHYDTSPSSIFVKPFTITYPPASDPNPPVQTWATLRKISWLYAHFIGDFGGTNWVNGAALQAAIWAVLEEDQHNAIIADIANATNSPYFSISWDHSSRTNATTFGLIVSQANYYLTQLIAAKPND